MQSSFLPRSSLRVLKIEHCNALKCTPSVKGLTPLQELSIIECKELEILPNQQGFLHFLPALEELEIHDCPKVNMGAPTPFPSLKSLSINGMIVVDHLRTNRLLTALT